MGITLVDNEKSDNRFDINFWHWRAIVEAVRRLEVLPEAVVDGLHEPMCCNGLTTAQARAISSALCQQVLTALADGERLLLHGEVTTEPDNQVFHKIGVERNYSTDRQVLQQFADYCETCNGFQVI